MSRTINGSHSSYNLQVIVLDDDTIVSLSDDKSVKYPERMGVDLSNTEEH
jgi:hypothetical protein